MRLIDEDALVERIRGLLLDPDISEQVWSSDVLDAIRNAPTVGGDDTIEQLCEKYGLTPKGIEHALEAYQTIICEITHGLLSKLTYDASYVLSCARDRWCETCDRGGAG